MALKLKRLLLAAVFVALGAPIGAYAADSCENGVVTVTYSTNDLWKSITAIRIATLLATEEGGCANVTLFLAIEGVRIADSSEPKDLNFGRDPVTLGQALEEFMDTGNPVLACGPCLSQIGLLVGDPPTPSDNLLEGVSVPTRTDLANMYATADVNLVF